MIIKHIGYTLEFWSCHGHWATDISLLSEVKLREYLLGKHNLLEACVLNCMNKGSLVGGSRLRNIVINVYIENYRLPWNDVLPTKVVLGDWQENRENNFEDCMRYRVDELVKYLENKARYILPKII